tara:strand:+ start:370 stop:1671 length:1302 start_codon:yes stop_codon:yes gene_type:complete
MLIIKSCEEFSQTEITPSLKVDGVAQGNTIDIDKLKTYNSLMFKTSQGIDPQKKMTINNESFGDGDICQDIKDGKRNIDWTTKKIKGGIKCALECVDSTAQECLACYTKEVSCEEECSDFVNEPWTGLQGAGTCGNCLEKFVKKIPCWKECSEVGGRFGNCSKCWTGVDVDIDERHACTCNKDWHGGPTLDTAWGCSKNAVASDGRGCGGFSIRTDWSWNPNAEFGTENLWRLVPGKKFCLSCGFDDLLTVDFDLPPCVYDWLGIDKGTLLDQIIKAIIQDWAPSIDALKKSMTDFIDFDQYKEIIEGTRDFFRGLVASLEQLVLNGIPDVMNRILTGGFNTKGFNITTFTTGIKAGFNNEQFAGEGGGNWFRPIVDWFVDIFKHLFAWIIHPISALFSSVYGFFLSICYAFMIVILVGIILDIFSIAKIWAG